MPYPGQRHLTELILRKLLASSSMAIAGTLETMKQRLETLQDEKVRDDPEFAELLVSEEDLEDDLLDEILEIDPPEAEAETETENQTPAIDSKLLNQEIAELTHLADWAKSIGTDTKTCTLLNALDIGFEQMAAIGAQRKALIFTESKRTQTYLKQFLEANGYAGEVVEFSGSNNGSEATAIYQQWLAANQESGRITRASAYKINKISISYVLTLYK